jgi:hypothetical protein
MWRCDVNSDHQELDIEGKIYRHEDLLRLTQIPWEIG